MFDRPAFAEVVPLIRLPRRLGIFDYRIPRELTDAVSVGSLAWIPFRTRRLPAIVNKLKTESDLPLSKMFALKNLVDLQPMMSESALKIFHRLALECGVSLATLLVSALPEVPQRTIPDVITVQPPRPRGFNVPQSWIPRIQSALSSLVRSRSVVLQADEPRLCTAILLRLAIEAHQQKRHLRILAANPSVVVRLAHLFNHHGVSTARLTATDSKTSQFRLWRSLCYQTLPVLIGTRNAVFLPFPPQSTLILLDEESDDWKQGEGGPRFDIRSVAEMLSKHSIINRLVRITLIPRPSTHLRITHDIDTLVDIRLQTPTEPFIIDMDREIRSGNRSPLSDELAQRIAAAKKSILFVYRKGSGTILLCADCGRRFRCSHCEAMLAVHRNELRCPACNNLESIPLFCPSCCSARLKRFGTGAEQVEDHLKRLFPERNIMRFSREANRASRDLFNNLRAGEWDILVGTEAIVPTLAPWGLDSLPAELVAIVDADGLLHRSDFRGKEKLGRIVAHLHYAAARQHAPFLIQTVFPESAVWNAGCSPASFMEEELNERRIMHYPPFVRIAKFAAKAPVEADAILKAEAVRALFENAKNDIPSLLITGPYAATPSRMRNNYRQLVLLRFTSDDTDQIIAMFSKIPDSVLIDLDPVDISC